MLINRTFVTFQSLSGVKFLTVGVVHEADDALVHESSLATMNRQVDGRVT